MKVDRRKGKKDEIRKETKEIINQLQNKMVFIDVNYKKLFLSWNNPFKGPGAGGEGTELKETMWNTGVKIGKI